MARMHEDDVGTLPCTLCISAQFKRNDWSQVSLTSGGAWQNLTDLLNRGSTYGNKISNLISAGPAPPPQVGKYFFFFLEGAMFTQISRAVE